MKYHLSPPPKYWTKTNLFTPSQLLCDQIREAFSTKYLMKLTQNLLWVDCSTSERTWLRFLSQPTIVWMQSLQYWSKEWGLTSIRRIDRDSKQNSKTQIRQFWENLSLLDNTASSMRINSLVSWRVCFKKRCLRLQARSCPPMQSEIKSAKRGTRCFYLCKFKIRSKKLPRRGLKTRV